MDKKILLDCIKKADNNPSEYNKTVLSGLSGEKIISLLRNMAPVLLANETAYLEVGVFQGLSLLSVAGSVPESKAYGIDNFAFFDSEGKNMKIVNERMQKLGIKNADIINEDYENALERLSTYTANRKIALYFVDGPHDYRSQLMCLLLIRPHLAATAVIVIDDCNYRHVRQANRDFLLTNPEYKLIFQAYTKAHPSNLIGDDRKDAERGWWNGINVIVKDSNNQFLPFYPPTLRDRTLFENDHTLHTVRYPEALKKYSGLIDSLAGITGSKFSRDLKGRYKSLNTFSDGLSADMYNPSFFTDNE